MRLCSYLLKLPPMNVRTVYIILKYKIGEGNYIDYLVTCMHYTILTYKKKKKEWSLSRFVTEV